MVPEANTPSFYGFPFCAVSVLAKLFLLASVEAAEKGVASSE